MEKRLGKGIEALLSEGGGDPTGKPKKKVENISVAAIAPNPNQPRKRFDDDELDALASSIKEKGIIQPVLLRQLEEGYELVAGERRWRAAERLDLKDIPAIVRKDIDEDESLQLSIVENIQREELDPVEEANAYKRLVDRFGYTLDDVGRLMGKKKSTVSNSLRLLSLPEEVLELLSAKKLSAGHAKAVLSIAEEETKKRFARRIVREGLSVREAERIAKRMQEGPKKKRTQKKDPEVQRLEGQLREKLGTKVSISCGKKRGRIEIEYFSPADLDRLLGLLLD